MAKREWNDLREEARSLEARLGQEIETYERMKSKFVSQSLLTEPKSIDDPENPETLNFLNEASETKETEITDLLTQLQQVNDALSAYASTSGGGGSKSQTQHHTVDRHREVLASFQRSYHKTKASIIEIKEHAELVSQVQSDITSFRNNPSGGRMDQLLRERQQLHGANNMTDDVLGQAAAAYDELGRQRNILNRVMPNVQNLAARFPRLQSLMTNIRRRKYKNKVILGSVITLCLILLIFYSVS